MIQMQKGFTKILDVLYENDLKSRAIFKKFITFVQLRILGKLYNIFHNKRQTFAFATLHITTLSNIINS